MVDSLIKFGGKMPAAEKKLTSAISETLDDDIQLVTFVLGNEEFGIDILQVHEINRMMEVTKVPKAQDFILGVINLRGAIIPVVDLSLRFSMPVHEHDKKTRILIIEAVGRLICFIVDEIKEVLRITYNRIEPPPEIVAGIGCEYIRGVGKVNDRLINILDVNKLFDKNELLAFEKVAEMPL
jgi:purine-binding chemotaxis protein CheW